MFRRGTKSLDNEDYLTLLLDDNNFESKLNVCSQGRSEFLDIFNSEFLTLKLIEYITVESTSTEEKRKYKYPYLAFRLLCSECALAELAKRLLQFAGSSAGRRRCLFMDKLFQFIHRNNAILQHSDDCLVTEHPTIATVSRNSTIATYFVTFFNKLLEECPDKVLTYIYDEGECAVRQLVRNIAITDSMKDLLLKLMTSQFNYLALTKNGEEKSTITSQQNIKWWIENNVFEHMIGMFSFDYPDEVERFCALLSDLVNMNDHSIVKEVLSENMLNAFFNKALQEGADCMLNGIFALFTTIIKLYQRQPSLENTTPDALRYIVSKLSTLTELLSTPPQIESVTLSTGKLDPPLGILRLKVVQFFESILKSYFQRLEAEIIACRTFGIITELFFTYEWNNILHNSFVNIAKAVMTSTNNDLKRAFLVEHNFISKAMSELGPEQQLSNSKKKGYVGQLVNALNIVIDSYQSDTFIKTLVDNEASCFQHFTTTVIAERNYVEKNFICGGTTLLPPISFNRFGDSVNVQQTTSKQQEKSQCANKLQPMDTQQNNNHKTTTPQEKRQRLLNLLESPNLKQTPTQQPKGLMPLCSPKSMPMSMTFDPIEDDNDNDKDNDIVMSITSLDQQPNSVYSTNFYSDDYEEDEFDSPPPSPGTSLGFDFDLDLPTSSSSKASFLSFNFSQTTPSTTQTQTHTHTHTENGVVIHQITHRDLAEIELRDRKSVV